MRKFPEGSTKWHYINLNPPDNACIRFNSAYLSCWSAEHLTLTMDCTASLVGSRQLESSTPSRLYIYIRSSTGRHHKIVIGGRMRSGTRERQIKEAIFRRSLSNGVASVIYRLAARPCSHAPKCLKTTFIGNTRWICLQEEPGLIACRQTKRTARGERTIRVPLTESSRALYMHSNIQALLPPTGDNMRARTYTETNRNV